MSWDAVGALAELLGALGVIISLIYLATQIRSANRAAAVQAKLESTKLLTDYVDSLIRYPELSDLWLKGIADRESLSREDYIRFSNMALKAYWYFSAGYFQHRQGTLAEGEWKEVLAVVDYWMMGKGTIRWWQTTGHHMFGPDFVAFINRRYGQMPGGPGLPVHGD